MRDGLLVIFIDGPETDPGSPGGEAAGNMSLSETGKGVDKNIGEIVYGTGSTSEEGNQQGATEGGSVCVEKLKKYNNKEK